VSRGESALSEDELLNVHDYRESGVYSELQCRVLDYATALTNTPANASDELVAWLKQELGDEALVELTGMIAWENFRSRFNRGFDIGADDLSEGAVCVLPQR